MSRQPTTSFAPRASTTSQPSSTAWAQRRWTPGGLSLHAQSHGESFLALVIERFGANGLYLLDEPEAALSPQGQLTLLRRIHELAEDGSQLIIATHSPILVALPHATIYELSDDVVIATTFEKIAHVQLYRSFLDDPDRFLHHLLSDE